MSSVDKPTVPVDLVADPYAIVKNKEKAEEGSKPTAPSALPSNFNFSNYTAPFVAIITFTTGGVKRVFSCVHLTFVSIKSGVYEIIHAIYVVFHRLIIPPKFNPESASFAKSLDQLKERLPKLQAQFFEMSTRGFTYDYMMDRDLDELHQLNQTINQNYQLVTDYAMATGRPVPPMKMHEAVISIKNGYDALEKDRIAFNAIKRGKIVDSFEDMVKMFTKNEVPIPKEIHRDFLKLYNKIKSVLGEKDIGNDGFQEKLRKANLQLNLMGTLAHSKDIDVKPSKPNEPLKLINIGASSCWLDSVVQSVLSVDVLVKNIRQPIERNGFLKEEEKFRSEKEIDDKYNKVLAIQKELLKLTEPLRGGARNNLTLTEFILLLARGGEGRTSIMATQLREEIFKIGNDEYTPMYKNSQRDAAPLMELIIRNFLPCCKFKIQDRKTTPAFDGLEFTAPLADEPLLQLAIPEGNKTLAELIELDLCNVFEHNAAKFDPKDGKPINGKPNSYLKDETVTTTFTRNRRLVDLPEVMVFHLKRYLNVVNEKGDGYNLVKVKHPVKLPRSGIIDLTKYCDASNGKPEKALYRIKSFVEHSGDYSTGHYVSYVEKEGKYYLCDDMNKSEGGFRELVPPKNANYTARDMFFAKTNPYMIVTQRLTPEEVAQVEAETRKRVEAAAKKKAEEASKKAAAQNKKPAGNNPSSAGAA